MASREELTILRDARAGKASAQIMLGKRYLKGDGTFGKNLSTALYWLDLAARQGTKEAWVLIGGHIPIGTALSVGNPASLLRWYALAVEEGVMHAGLVLGCLVLEYGYAIDEAMRRKAWDGIRMAARADIPGAKWRLARFENDSETISHVGEIDTRAISCSQGSHGPIAHTNADAPSTQRILADWAWQKGDSDSFLRHALPLARAMAGDHSGRAASAQDMPEGEATFLTRCGHILSSTKNSDPSEIALLWKLAAKAGNRDAQLSLGLFYAKMNVAGERIDANSYAVDYGQSVRWLKAAAHDGSADAWYVLSILSQEGKSRRHGAADARLFMENAATAGHLGAQLELARAAWRDRDKGSWYIECALSWLTKAVAQHSREAQDFLAAISTNANPAPWADTALKRLGTGISRYLQARLELAAAFGLTQPEALLIDVNAANCRYALWINIQAQYYRRKQRLILVSTSEQYQTLNRIARLFRNIDCGPNGPEGSYRERYSRLRAALGARIQ